MNLIKLFFLLAADNCGQRISELSYLPESAQNWSTRWTHHNQRPRATEVEKIQRGYETRFGMGQEPDFGHQQASRRRR